MNKLYFGDNLEIMKDLLKQNPNGFIDLIYIDPPFNSKRNYNVLYESIDMEDTKAQKQAFADTWSNVSYLDTLREIQDIDMDLYEFINALDKINISKGAISYLATMGIRIWYMHKLLKDTGSFYLHCDSTMSHYLKIVCDLIFLESNFHNEIIWRRTFNAGSSKSISKRFPTNTDTILFYSKSKRFTVNKSYRPYSEGALKRYDKIDEKGRRFKWNPLKTYSEERLKKLIETGEAKITATSKYPVYKHYFDPSKGAPVTNLWDDIENIGTKSKERLDYPTQKPEALLERIIEASSNKGGVVADFFCGCGTAISVAQKLKRKWVGVDISHLAVKLITKRLMDAYGTGVRKTFEIFGFPQDIASARELATTTRKGRLKFEEWIIEVMLHGVLNEKKNQPGFDGYLTLDMPWKKEFVLIEVKSGNASLQQVNHFIQTIKDREAVMGLFVCFAGQVTDGMKQAAKKERYYLEQNFGRKFEKLQIITVEDLLENKLPNLPPAENITFKKAATAKEENHEVELDL
jgi:DNA modification methylase